MSLGRFVKCAQMLNGGADAKCFFRSFGLFCVITNKVITNSNNIIV